MARSRVIKPEFWSDEKLARVGREARLLYIGLWSTCDDAGRTKGHAQWLKGQIFPYDDVSTATIDGWLSDLVALRRILPYTADGERYFFIPAFLKHQKIQHPSPARNPAPPPDLFTSASGTPHEQTETETETEAETETGPAGPPEGVSFEEFWKAYPRKKSKGHAEAAWSDIRPDPALFARMIETIGRQRGSPEWQRDNGKYIPYPARWLKGKGWEDEPPGGRPPARPIVPVTEERKRATRFTGPDCLKAILERHGFDPRSGEFRDG